MSTTSSVIEPSSSSRTVGVSGDPGSTRETTAVRPSGSASSRPTGYGITIAEKWRTTSSQNCPPAPSRITRTPTAGEPAGLYTRSDVTAS
ncbi:hypothetical protein [Candidatus Solirubrobacter pratensis]|uniref:hypothetical protein n=1 Tax=Candidatus Solirubrobacter pratensis TaxID=1298857 RepID=UPI00048761CA|nr:hypothetical protein [Candidatus Solirubrobacter pratensis]